MEESSLLKLKFVNSASTNLPTDASEDPTQRDTPGVVFSKVIPTPVDQPRLVALSKSAFKDDLGIELPIVNSPEYEECVTQIEKYFSGNELLPGSVPVAMCYCGHQFGYFSGQLGDGRAISLGDIINEKGQPIDLQLKGAGKTPYSRTADGRAVLRSSIREFLCSEHMYALDIPTSRAPSLVTSETRVIRDPLYDGNPVKEQASICLRTAPSFLRFGNWEIFSPVDAVTGRKGPSDDPKYHSIGLDMLDYLISVHFPSIENSEGEAKYVSYLKEISKRTAELLARWQTVGFVHGVLNTDNLSAVGITIDYGPFGFMEHHNSSYIPNHSDDEGRYSYENQVEMCLWNVQVFTESVVKLLKDTSFQEVKKIVTDIYNESYTNLYQSLCRKKLGFLEPHSNTEKIISSFMTLLESSGCDFTNGFRNLSQIVQLLEEEQPTDQDYELWFEKFFQEHLASPLIMSKIYHKMTEFDDTLIDQLLLSDEQMLKMYTGKEKSFFIKEKKRRDLHKKWKNTSLDEKRESDKRHWVAWLKGYREIHLQNESFLQTKSERITMMNQNNPKYILRNYLAQNAIEKAENGDYSEVKRLLEVMTDPYDLKSNDPQNQNYCQTASNVAYEICVSCSS